MLDIKKGDVIVSEPFMKDPNFKRTVIMLTEHDKDGSLGLVLNKPSIFTVNEMIQDLPLIHSQMYLGGPVGLDRLNFLHSYGDLIPNSHFIAENLYWNGNYDVLKKLIIQKEIAPHNIKFFVGYAGWGAGQLEEEMNENSWYISKNYKKIFRDHDAMWSDVLIRMGGKYKLAAFYPEDPSLN